MTTPLTLKRVAEEDFFSLIGMDNLPDEEKEQILNDMNETVQAKVYLRIFEQLDEEGRKKMEELTGDDLAHFLVDKGFDLTGILLEEALTYRMEVATLFLTATETPSAATAAPTQSPA